MKSWKDQNKKRFPKKPKAFEVPRGDWQPPEDMHPDMARLVLAGKCCGAKRLFTPGYCSNKPAVCGVNKMRMGPPPWKCRFHGGLASGAPVGNQNARKVLGLYADLLLPGEEKWLEEIQQNDLSFEIAMMKVRLRRVAEAELKWEEDNRLQLEETVTKRVRDSLAGVGISFQKGRGRGRPKKRPPGMCRVRRELTISEYTETRRRPDFKRALHEASRELVKLMDTQAVLKGEGGYTDEQKKELARRFIQEIKEKAADRGALRPDVPKEKDDDE